MTKSYNTYISEENMSKSFNNYISRKIKLEYIIKDRTEDEKQDYEDKLKNDLFNSGMYHDVGYAHKNVPPTQRMEKELKSLFTPLYHYYKDQFDMGDNVVDAIDDSQKLFSLYALAVFDELMDEIVREKTDEGNMEYEQCETCGADGTHGEYEGCVWCKECYYDAWEDELDENGDEW